MPTTSRESTISMLAPVVSLRLIVGFLGEKGQAAWWPTDFYSKTAPSFLNPIFAKNAALAQYNGVKEAARLVHDERIGVGRVFHLFRLPETMEQSLFEFLSDPEVIGPLASSLESADAALAQLEAIAKSTAPLREGPLQIGTVSDLDSHRWLTEAARAYLAALQADARCFPYLLDDA